MDELKFQPDEKLTGSLDITAIVVNQVPCMAVRVQHSSCDGADVSTSIAEVVLSDESEMDRFIAQAIATKERVLEERPVWERRRAESQKVRDKVRQTVRDKVRGFWDLTFSAESTKPKSEVCDQLPRSLL